MNEKELEELVVSESEWAEAHRDMPFLDDYTIEHRGVRSRVRSVRFSEDEHERLRAAAESAHLTVSQLIRLWVAERLDDESEGTDLKAMAHTLESLSKRLAALG